MHTRTDAEWIETVTPFFVAQQHVQVDVRGITSPEAVITQMTPHTLQLSMIYGANPQVPYADIVSVRRVGSAALALDARVTRHLSHFARAMARGETLRIETAQSRIEAARPQSLTLASVQVVDARTGGVITLPLHDLWLLAVDTTPAVRADSDATVPDGAHLRESIADLLSEPVREPRSSHAPHEPHR